MHFLLARYDVIDGRRSRGLALQTIVTVSKRVLKKHLPARWCGGQFRTVVLMGLAYP